MGRREVEVKAALIHIALMASFPTVGSQERPRCDLESTEERLYQRELRSWSSLGECSETPSGRSISCDCW